MSKQKRQLKPSYQTTKQQFIRDYFIWRGEENPISLDKFLKICKKEGVLHPGAAITEVQGLIYPARKYMEKNMRKTIIRICKKTYQLANGSTDNFGESRKRDKRVTGASNSRELVVNTIKIEKFLPETQSRIQKYINRIEIASENIKFNQQQIDQAVAEIKRIEGGEEKDIKQIN